MKIIQCFIYLISSIRIKLFQSKILKTHTFDVPVLSVGNIAMGGTGKTPMASWLIQYLMSINKKPCLITRGYGRLNKKTVVVNPNKEKFYSIHDLGDEPFSLWKKHPGIAMVVGNNKIKAINLAIKTIGCDVVVLDDGFQSLYIWRNLDIVMINAKKDSVLMREKPININRADVVVFKNLDGGACLDASKLSNIKPGGALKIKTKNILGFDVNKTFQDSFFVVCGIGDPNSFMASLKQHKISINGFLHYDDHYNYSDLDLKNIICKMKSCNAKTIITTSKDYYKLDGINKYNVKIVMVDFSIDFVDNDDNYNNKSELLSLINEKIK